MEIPEQTARALVGPKADYYLTKWANTGSDEKMLGFNWPAFFLGPIWMLYRKMYRLAGMFIALIVAIELLERAIAFAMHSEEFPQSIDRALGIGIAIVVARFATYWYLGETRRRYQSLQANGALSDATASEAGGVSRFAVFLGVLGTVLVVGTSAYFFE